MKNSRRQFLASVGSLAALPAFPAILSTRSPNALLSHACVGTANMAGGDLKSIASHKRTHITALCDVDSAFLAAAHKRHPDARIYRSWKEMLEKEGDRIDSVNVSTPDHMHAPVILAALARGKNVYAQKPLCHSLAECRAIEKLVNEKRAVTQLGTQIASWVCDRQTVAAIESGAIGRIKHVWLFTNSGWFANGRRAWPLPADPVPATLDWKLWLGDQVPCRPYAKGVYHPRMWRHWCAFGSSWLGDMGSHIFSPVWLGMRLGMLGPTAVRAEVIDDKWSATFREQFWPRMAHITWTFPGVKATGGQPFDIEWCDGPLDPKLNPTGQFLLPPEIRALAARTHFKTMPLQGRVIEGEDGWILSTHFGRGAGSMPAFVMKNGKKPPVLPELPEVRSHYHEYLDCCLDGGEPRSRLNWSARFTETIVLGNEAQLMPGRTIRWNAETGVKTVEGYNTNGKGEASCLQ